MNESVNVIKIGNIAIEELNPVAVGVHVYRVGDPVKVLMKEYSETWKTYPGTVVGFDQFKERPTIIIAYLYNSFNNQPEIRFQYINKDTKDVEICPAHKNDLPMHKMGVIQEMEAAIRRKEEEVEDMKRKLEFFKQNFAVAFSGWEE